MKDRYIPLGEAFLLNGHPLSLHDGWRFMGSSNEGRCRALNREASNRNVHQFLSEWMTTFKFEVSVVGVLKSAASPKSRPGTEFQNVGAVILSRLPGGFRATRRAYWSSSH